MICESCGSDPCVLLDGMPPLVAVATDDDECPLYGDKPWLPEPIHSRSSEEDR